MGLDWMLERRGARPGYEKRVSALSAMRARVHRKLCISKNRREDFLRRIDKRLVQASVSCFEVIGCPQIGIHPEATEWFRTYYEEQRRRAEEPGPDQELPPFLKKLVEEGRAVPLGATGDEHAKHWSRPFHEVLHEHTGEWVPQLARDRRGLARYVGSLCLDVDFRGACVANATIIDCVLAQEAYGGHSAAESLDYADRLERSLSTFVQSNPNREQEVEIKESLDEINAAIAWLRFWGQRGFGWTIWI